MYGHPEGNITVNQYAVNNDKGKRALKTCMNIQTTPVLETHFTFMRISQDHTYI